MLWSPLETDAVTGMVVVPSRWLCPQGDKLIGAPQVLDERPQTPGNALGDGLVFETFHNLWPHTMRLQTYADVCTWRGIDVSLLLERQLGQTLMVSTANTQNNRVPSSAYAIRPSVIND